MALTTYTAATNIIGTLGTTPEDRVGMTDQQLKDKFDENAVNIAAFLNALIGELASTAAGKGASALGVQDSAGRITATNVEAALAELAGSGRTTETLKSLADLISNLAGAGRTTETVKGNADAIATHTATISWTAPTLQNSWVDYGGIYETAGHTKDAHGFVHLKGLVKNGTATAGTLLFTLPAGSRPAAVESFVVYSIITGNVGVIQIGSNGNVSIIAGSNTAFSFSGVVFKAA